MEKKTQFDREALLGILEKLRPGLADHDSLEQATNFVFKDDMVWSFNDEVAVSHPLPKSPGFTGAIPALPLLGILSKGSTKTVELAAGESELTIVCGKAKASLVKNDIKLPVDSIPLPKTGTWINLPKDFAEKLHLASMSVGRSASQQILSCAHITDEKAEGCDNFQLTVATFSEKIKGLLPALIQRGMLSHIISFGADAVAQVDSWIHFINKDDVVLSCRSTDGEYPDMKELLSHTGAKVELPEELSAILDRAGVFAKKLSEDEKVSLAMDASGALQVSAKNEFGRFEETLATKNRKISFKMEMDPEVLQSALRLSQTFLVGEFAIVVHGKCYTHVVSLM